MVDNAKAFHGFSVDDIEAARKFYGDVLGVPLREQNGMLFLQLGGGTETIVYAKGEAHSPASFTILNFPVADVEKAVDELTAMGVAFQRYAGTPMQTDEKGVFRGGGPLIAWFTDPAGNVLSVIEQ